MDPDPEIFYGSELYFSLESVGSGSGGQSQFRSVALVNGYTRFNWVLKNIFKRLRFADPNIDCNQALSSFGSGIYVG